MKKLAIILFSIFTIGAFAQSTKNCVTPISNYVFSQQFSNISSRNGEAQKLAIAKNIAKNNCLSTTQIKQIAELFENDYNRLSFVQEAYANTTDKDNFYEVYNTFMYFSTVFRLHDYITGLKTESTEVVEVPTNTEMTFPNIQYPDFRRYYGKVGCKNFPRDDEFSNLAQRVFKERSEYRKLMVANGIVDNQCLTTEQAIKIASLLRTENERLTFLKRAHSKVYDPDNYRFAGQLFKEEQNIKEIESLLSTNVVVVTDEPACEVSATEFQEIKNQISKERFNNTKVNLGKQIIKSKKCFKTDQVIELLKLYTYSDSKMIIAKYAYEFTTDKDNYYKVANSFSFTNYKNEILDFIKKGDGR